MSEGGEGREMPFLHHIYELRSHLIRSFIAIFAGAIICVVFWKTIREKFIMAPLKSDFFTYKKMNALSEWFGAGPIYKGEFDYTESLLNLVPSGQITSQIYAVLICGLIVAIPYIVWEIWRFIKPGLTSGERKNSGGTVVAISLFFLTGVFFSFFFMLPFAVQFLFFYNPFGVQNEWTLSAYTSLFVQTLLGMGLIFLFPVFAYFLSKVGILTPKFLRTYRKHAVVVILVVAAIITPADILSMVIAAIPLLLLYEFSILITVYVTRKQEKELKKSEN